MEIKIGGAITSSDGMFTVLIKTERVLSQGILMVSTEHEEKIYLRVSSGKEIERNF